jgi:hypothetical protein
LRVEVADKLFGSPPQSRALLAAGEIFDHEESVTRV